MAITKLSAFTLADKSGRTPFLYMITINSDFKYTQDNFPAGMDIRCD